MAPYPLQGLIDSRDHVIHLVRRRNRKPRELGLPFDHTKPPVQEGGQRLLLRFLAALGSG